MKLSLFLMLGVALGLTGCEGPSDYFVKGNLVYKWPCGPNCGRPVLMTFDPPSFYCQRIKGKEAFVCTPGTIEQEGDFKSKVRQALEELKQEKR